MNPSAPNQPQPYQQAAQPYAPTAPGYPPGGYPNIPAPASQSAAAPMYQQPAAMATQQPASTQVQKAVVPGNPNSTQNSLQIAEIRDGLVIMNDGTFRSAIMVKSINFDLMSPSEQESVEYGYQGFLNSLYFPIQIFVRSQKVDLQPYIEKLDKIRTEHDNMLLALLMEDYIAYIDTLSQQTNIMDKKFYIIIPYASTPEADRALVTNQGFLKGLGDLFGKKEQRVVINEKALEKAKTELRNRVQAVLSGLVQCGVKGLPLDTQELIELYYDTYNPDTATRQQLKNFDDLTTDVVTKGEGAAPQAHLQRELG